MIFTFWIYSSYIVYKCLNIVVYNLLPGNLSIFLNVEIILEKLIK